MNVKGRRQDRHHHGLVSGHRSADLANLGFMSRVVVARSLRDMPQRRASRRRRSGACTAIGYRLADRAIFGQGSNIKASNISSNDIWSLAAPHLPAPRIGQSGTIRDYLAAARSDGWPHWRDPTGTGDGRNMSF